MDLLAIFISLLLLLLLILILIIVFYITFSKFKLGSSKKLKVKKTGVKKEGAVIRLFAFCLFLISITIYLVSTYFSAYPDLKGLLDLISAGILTTSIFSIFLGFFPFMDYVAKILISIVVKREYLSGLSKSEKNRLKKSIDEGLFGRGAMENPDSLYYFLNEKLIDLFTSPYRTEFHDMYY